MKRFIRISLAVLALSGFGLLVWLVALPSRPPASAPIVLPDGSWVRIEAVTYGTNHLVGPRLAYAADRTPQLVRNLMRRYLGRAARMRFFHATSSPKLVLWLNRGVSATAFPTNIGYLECVLSDTNGTTCGDLAPYAARYSLETKEFAVFPRRQREIMLTIYYHDSAGAVFKQGSVAFANPEYRRYPKWEPEPLPATKRAGDVEVTLEKISTGADKQLKFENSPNTDGPVSNSNIVAAAGATVCRLRLRPTTNSNEIWRVVGVIASDATGNRLTRKTFDDAKETGDVMFSPTLWTGEPAWKLNFEIARGAGFSEGELITFRDVPLGGMNVTNRIGWTTNRNGVQITLEQTAQRELPQKPDHWISPSEFEIRLGVAGLTNNLRLDLISAAPDLGVELVRHWQSDAGTNQIHRFASPPMGAKSANLTFALQSGRWVEFLVKPETGTTPPEITPKPTK